MPRLFSEITRYRPSPSRNPDEESLTEVFAAVLRRSSAAARAVAECCGAVGVPSDGSIGVSTQVRARELERVDVEVVFRHPTNLHGRLWLELKWNAPPSLEQLDRYAAELATRDGGGRVVLLAPWRSVSTDAELHKVPDRWKTWTAVAHALRGALPTVNDAVESYLVTEFIDYLRENDLSADQGVDLQSLAVLERSQAAIERFRALVDALDHAVARETGWQPTTWAVRSNRAGEFQLGHYRAHDAVLETDGRVELSLIEFHLRSLPAEVDERQPLGLGAGVKLRTASKPDYLEERARSNGLSDVHCVQPGGAGDWFVMRYMPLAQVLDCATVDEQAARLATFANETWQALETRPQTA